MKTISPLSQLAMYRTHQNKLPSFSVSSKELGGLKSKFFIFYIQYSEKKNHTTLSPLCKGQTKFLYFCLFLNIGLI